MDKTEASLERPDYSGRLGCSLPSDSESSLCGRGPGGKYVSPASSEVAPADLHEAFADRVHGDLRSAIERQLLVDVRDVVAHRLVPDLHPAGDLHIRAAAGDHRQDLELPRRD